MMAKDLAEVLGLLHRAELRNRIHADCSQKIQVAKFKIFGRSLTATNLAMKI